LPQILSPYLSFRACIAGTQMSGVIMRDPPAAHDTTLPSILDWRGGPPHAAYPVGLEELVIPQIVGV
jgi:hypothetical protein